MSENKMSFQSLMAQANKSPIETSVSVAILPAGTYLARKPRLSMSMGLSGENAKKPGSVFGNLDFNFTIDDPKMKELELPARELAYSLQTASFQDATMGLGLKTIETEGGDVAIGLATEQNPRFWGAIGAIFAFCGVAETADKGSKFTYPEESEIQHALNSSDSYIAAGEAILSGEIPKLVNGKDCEEEKLFGLCMAQHQVAAVQAVLTKYDQQFNFSFEVEVGVTADYRDKSKDVNTVSKVFFLPNEDDRIQII